MHMKLYRNRSNYSTKKVYSNLPYLEPKKELLTYRAGRKFRGGFNFAWVADDTKIIHVEGGINTCEIF